ncbi:pilus assembly protein FimV [Duganella sp. Leaf126]|nr:pilus assembly protein FimV [Duganella sp. Leaf126]
MISANAAGLGKLTVLSALGQPLRAEIEVSAVTAEEAGGLSVRLASQEAFRTANIDFNPALSALRFEVEQRNGRPLVRVSSSQPLNEPFVDLLLELNWNGGRMVREYTFLLDPPEMRAARSPQVAAPVDLGPARTPTTTAAAAPAAPAAAPAAARPPAAGEAGKEKGKEKDKPAVEEVTVKRGDTLTAIANQVKPADVSLDVMLVALYRANPEAFMGKNMNRLKSGQILAVPDAGAIRAANAGEGDAEASARSVVVAHARDFNAYRARLAGQVANSTPAADAGTGQNSSGKITAKVEEKPNAVNAARDKLTLSKATSGKPGEGNTGAAVEDKIARQKQVDDASSRVKELEKNVTDLEKLMEVKSKSAATAPAETAAASAPAASPPAGTAPAGTAPAASAPAAPAKMAPVIPPRKLEEPGLFGKLMANSQMVGLLVAGLLVAVVAALAAVAARRRRKFVVPRDDAGPDGLDAAPAWDPAPAAPAAAAAAAAAASQAGDERSAFESHLDAHLDPQFAPSASQLDNNDVDPVAEADVYIAYGRDTQAEELLKEALRTHPERDAVRLKLLEIYANRQDARAFETQASELYALTRGQGDDWAQAARMGRELEPGNPLYASATPEGADGFGAAPLAATAGAVAAATAAAAYAAYDHDDGEPGVAAAAAPGAYDAGVDGERDGGIDQDLPPAADAAISPASMAAQSHEADFGLGDLDFAAPEQAAPASSAPDPYAQDPYAQDPLAKVPADAAPFLQDDDFNLSYDTPAPAPEPAYDPSMDFTLDLPTDPAAPASAAPAPDASAEATRVPLDFDAADFTIPDVPALAVPPAEPSLGAEPAAPAPAVADKQAPPEFDLSGIDFDLSSEPTPAQAADTAGADTGRADTGRADADRADADRADAGRTETDRAETDRAETDRAETGPADTARAETGRAETGRAETGRAEPMSALQMEMDTKLDLAVAYQEIGDKEGARELLDEVLRGGSDEQVAKATAMKEKLG